MKKVALCLALAGLVSTECGSQTTGGAGGNCPSFPPKIVERKGGALGSAPSGEMVAHPPPSSHVELPTGPLSTVRIVLERTACLGDCPVYRLELRGNGEIRFHGEAFVTFPGDHVAHVSPAAVQCLLEDFRIADFWSLDSDYVAKVTDLPTSKIALTIGGKTKTLADYAGGMVGMPAAVTALEQAIDQAGGSDSWTTGDARTVARLESEHYDFHSRDAADALALAMENAPDAVALGLLARGTPIDGVIDDPFGDAPKSTIEAAAMNGRLALVKRLIAEGALRKGGRALVSATLRASVASRRADVVAEILKHHPDVNSTDDNGDTALALIFTGVHPYSSDEAAVNENAVIVRMLGKAGADPNRPNSTGRSLLELAASEDERASLIAIGTFVSTKASH